MSANHEQDRAALFNYLQAEYDYPFSGWDFSYLDGRMVEDLSVLTWDYRAAIEKGGNRDGLNRLGARNGMVSTTREAIPKSGDAILSRAIASWRVTSSNRQKRCTFPFRK